MFLNIYLNEKTYNFLYKSFTRKVIIVKLNTSFLFGHKKIVVISLAFRLFWHLIEFRIHFYIQNQILSHF